MHGKTSPGTSSSATIRSVSTRRSATEPPKRFTTSTSIGRPQRSQHHNSYPENTGPPSHCLGDPVGHGGHPENPGTSPATRLGYLHRHHRRWKVGPRRHPVPDLVEVV